MTKTNTRNDWRKCASVMTGGKSFFYFRRDALDRRQWIVWDRTINAWTLETEGTDVLIVKSVHEGMSLA